MRTLALLSLALPLFTACVAEDDSVEVDETSSELGVGPTTLTFYQHASLSGTTYTVSLGSSDANERIKLIAKPDVEAAGLLGRISAVRLRCGARDARIVLFDSYNASNTSFSSWSHLGGNGGTINCTSGQTVTVNLHDRFPALADRVASAFLTTHAAAVDHMNFTDFLESAWATAMDEVPSEVTVGRTEIWLTTTRTFRIRQFLTIDHWACTARGAVFEYSIRMSDTGAFTVSVTDSYVDYGLGDLWSCRDKMKASLDKAIADAAPKLADGLGQLVDLFAPDATRYYFVPDTSLRAFDLFYADPDPIVNTL